LTLFWFNDANLHVLDGDGHIRRGGYAHQRNHNEGLRSDHNTHKAGSNNPNHNNPETQHTRSAVT